jgi:alkylated DNA nucleotide flippase Atl1
MGGKFTSRTRWRGKLEKDQPAKLAKASGLMAKRLGPGNLLIPRPIDVDAVIRRIRKGKLVTVSQIRAKLASDFNRLPKKSRRAAACYRINDDSDDFKAASACPLCTGIFVRIAAEAAEEDRSAGKKQVTPYWRVVRDDGSLNEKFPGGPAAQAARLKMEGHRLEPTRTKKPPKVKNFEKRLVKVS